MSRTTAPSSAVRTLCSTPSGVRQKGTDAHDGEHGKDARGDALGLVIQVNARPDCFVAMIFSPYEFKFSGPGPCR